MFCLNASKKMVKCFIYSIRLIWLYHKIKNKNNLTVVMFHRVLSVDDPRWQSCDLEWTVSDQVFEQCIIFFKLFYNVVALDTLIDSYENDVPLPDRPLLITFDDGWSDNEGYALPILQKHNVPAVIFIVSAAVDKTDPFWEEHLFICWKTNQLPSGLVRLLPEKFRIFEFINEKNLRNFISEVNNLPADEKMEVTAKIIGQLPISSMSAMLSTAQVHKLLKNGITIGSHGATHNPLAHIDNTSDELRESKETVQNLLNDCDESCENICLSFPHGSYNKQITTKAFDTGYQFLFTSDPYLVPLSKGKLKHKILGRISIPYRVITDADGNLSKVALAFWLMNRSTRRLD